MKRIEPRAWNEQARAWLSRVDWDTGYNVDLLGADVEEGRKQLFHLVDEQGGEVGAVAVTVRGVELVIVGAAADAGEWMEWDAAMVKLARSVGTPYIRWSTSRAGMAKLSGHMGYHLAELVFRKAV